MGGGGGVESKFSVQLKSKLNNTQDGDAQYFQTNTQGGDAHFQTFCHLINQSINQLVTLARPRGAFAPKNQHCKIAKCNSVPALNPLKV